MKAHNIAMLLTAASVCAITAPGLAQDTAAQGDAAESADSSGIQDIVVTAQKRSESINRVAMSVTAVTADTLIKQNIISASDLQKAVPGFTLTEAPRGAPVFAIRGVGFDDSTVGSGPTVALYTDEVPIPFPMEARFPALDLERVEVLKGPQGILFGQNSTAGAINFIAAKPTEDLKAGFDASYGRFDFKQVSGFISGALTDTLRVRISAMGIHSGGWQTNRWLQGQSGIEYVDRTNLAAGTQPVTLGRDYQNSLGAKRGFTGRVIAEWEPISNLKATININGWIDRSDTQAAQLLYAFPLLSGTPYLPYDTYPATPRDARSADWDPYPNFDRTPNAAGKQEQLRRDDHFLQGSLRLDYRLSDDIKLTSISAFSRYHQNYAIDPDGTALSNFTIGDTANANSFNQELRVAGDFDRLKFIVGANYSRDKTSEYNRYYVDESSVYVGLLNNTTSGAFFRQPIRTYAAFGNVDFKPTEKITLHVGGRYTKSKRSYVGCTTDYGDGVQGGIFNIIIPTLNPPGAPLPDIQPGGCTSSNVLTSPSLVTPSNPRGEYFSPGEANFHLSESNFSWKLGIDFQATPTTLFYANVTKGYKSGGFPAVNVSNNFQLSPVTQESVVVYEIGTKAGLFDRRVQLNLAGFYNDYRDKQLRGRLLDPFGFFGVIDFLLNIPKSRVYGAEANLQMLPAVGLNLNLGASYVNSRVTGDTEGFYDPVGNQINYKGLRFPNTPEWNITASGEYERPLTNRIAGFVGANLLYQSSTMGLFARPEEISRVDLDPVVSPGVKVPGDAFNKRGFTTVDAQVGIKDVDGQWRAWLWGKNIFNEYYWVTATQSFDTIYRLAGMPVTYGVSVSFRF